MVVDFDNYLMLWNWKSLINYSYCQTSRALLCEPGAYANVKETLLGDKINHERN